MSKIFKAFSDWSGVNVFTQLYYSKHIKKIYILWIIFITSMLILTLYLTISTIVSFKFTIRILTSLNTDVAIFPSLAVCPNLYFRNDLYGVPNVDPTLNHGNTFGSKYTDYMKENSFKNPELFLENTLHVNRLVRGLSPSIKGDQMQYFIELATADGHYSNVHLNNSLEMVKSYSPKFGNCFIFTSKEDVALQKSGYPFGMSLIVKAEVGDIANHYKKGFGLNPILTIHTAIIDRLDLESTHFNTNLIPLGHETNIPITIKRDINDPRLSSCNTMAIESKNYGFTEGKYSSYTCFASCMKTRQVKLCDGLETPFKPIKERFEYDNKKCSSQQCITCSAYALFPEIEQHNSISFINTCECEIPCFQTSYRYTPNFAKIHIQNLAKALNIDASDENKKKDIESNYAIINLFAKDLAVMTRGEVKQGIISNIISDIGNNLNLLLGVGVFNIIEIIFCLLVFCFDKVQLYYKFRIMDFPAQV